MPDKGSAALEDVLRFSEKNVLLNHVTYMSKALEVCYQAFLNDVIDLILKLEEIWIEDLDKATDKKVHEECLPGKPMSVFTSSSPLVRF